ncbi:MAG: hypothetical protein SGBAC_009506, partial [Bacillariaceae sp.]
MTIPLKKRRTLHPKHMEATPEAVASSGTAADAAKSNVPTASSSSNHSLACACPVNEVPDVDTKQGVIQVTIKDQQAVIARSTMRVLQTCESQSEAEQAISAIRVLFFKKQAQNERRSDNLANMFVHLNAVPIILKAMAQWKDSLQFTSLATDVLKIFLFYVPSSRKSLFHLGGTRILIEACEEHWYLPMVKAALAALSNAAPSLTRDAEVIEECLAFVEKVMKVFDADAQIQRLGTYFCLKLAASVAMSRGYQVQIGPPD